MNWVSDLTLVLPEIWILSMACAIMVMDLFLPKQRKGMVHFAAMLTLIFAAILTLRPDAVDMAGQTKYAFSGTFVRDGMADLLKLFVYIVTALVFVYSKYYLRLNDAFKGEFYVLVLFATLGMMIMISGANMVTLYLGLELLALCSYALVAMQEHYKSSAEAALKYFVLGSLASGILLYGMSIIYGATGSLDLMVISAAVAQAGPNDTLLAFGLVFLVVGLAFKMGAVPFHMWIPDVYQGAPVAVTLFVGSAPKIAALALMLRFLDDGLPDLQVHWRMMLVLLAAASLLLGNLVALVQSNLKRMLAYSTISHVGFILLGVLAGPEGRAAAMFYAIIYAIMSAGAFGMIILLSTKNKEAEYLDDFKGLNQRSPWFALIMAFLMASMAGIPPFVGFFAKLWALQAAVSSGLVWLAVLAVVTAVIGAFYYLRVIKLMYFDEPDVDEKIQCPPDFKLTLSINGLAQLGLGIFAGPLLALCVAAAG